jgi:pimeloyl-ACP methyl ester carboxylesterase
LTGLRQTARRLARLLLTIAALVTAGSFASAGAKVGVVLLHGTLATPSDLDAVAKYLTDAGYVVEVPEMCWSKDRHYDKPYLECLAEIDPAVERLKAKGATAIVIGGFSIAGSAAIAYGARHTGLAGIIGLAPAHLPERLAKQPRIAKSLALAVRLNAAGQGNQVADFAIYADGEASTTAMRARVYPTFFAAGSPGFMPANVPKLTAPLLWVFGTNDRPQLGPVYAFNKAPKNPLNRYVQVDSDHAGTPASAKDAVLAWLGEIAAAQP